MTVEDSLARLRAGLAEDERIAREAIDARRPGAHWQWVTNETDAVVVPGTAADVLEAQIEAIRQVVELHEADAHGTCISCGHHPAHGDEYPCATLRALASIYPDPTEEG